MTSSCEWRPCAGPGAVAAKAARAGCRARNDARAGGRTGKDSAAPKNAAKMEPATLKARG